MSRRIACIIMVALMLVLCVVSTSSGKTYPIVTTDITVADGIKTYTYHLTNPVGSGYVIACFDISMPEAGARSVIEFIYPYAWGSEVYLNGDNPYGDTTYWGTSGPEIREGETLVLALTTPANVPTSYNYVVQQSSINWGWLTAHASYGGNSSLPIPVPEPSSLAGLRLAVCTLGCRVLRQRRQ